MSEATGTLVIREVGRTRTYAWNGNTDDREAARQAFNEFTFAGPYIAVAFDSPTAKVGDRVESFEELEKVELESGLVTAQLTRALVGG